MRGKNINYKCHLLSASVSFCALFLVKMTSQFIWFDAFFTFDGI